jgi:hypothetical protein
LAACAKLEAVPRGARVVAVGAPHHVTQRGNNRQKVFVHDSDRSKQQKGDNDEKGTTPDWTEGTECNPPHG